eukprot:330743-Ditylum_brightwellii.AAC.1
MAALERVHKQCVQEDLADVGGELTIVDGEVAAWVGWGMELVGEVAWEAVAPKVRCTIRREEGAAKAGARSVVATVLCCREGGISPAGVWGVM